MPRVALDWRLSAIDVDSVAGLVAALDRESRRLGLGEVEPADWLVEPGQALGQRRTGQRPSDRRLPPYGDDPNGQPIRAAA